MLYRPTVRTLSLVMASLAIVSAMNAQTTAVPEQLAAPGQNLSLDAAHLRDRPYDASLPKPIFPSSPRVQKEFTVRYIYDYAMSTYSPAAVLPVVSRTQIDRKTPEGAMIALVSAMQSGDFEAWLQCWDEDSRKTFTDAAKDGKRDAAFWKKLWQTTVMGKTVTLQYRLELVNYVVLDATLGTSGRAQSALFPSAFKNVNGQWFATNALGTNILLGNWQPGMAGLDNRVSPSPLAGLTGAAAQEARAQEEFLNEHGLRSEVDQAGQ